MSIFFYLILATLSILSVKLLLQYLVRIKRFDLPNDRSSHTLPTPRGGGLAIVCVFLLGLFLLYVTGVIDSLFFFSLFLSSILISTISYIDDKKHVPSGIRLIFHFLSAGILIYYFYSSYDGTISVLTGLLGVVIFFYIVWCINLYNFMDGIDGIAIFELFTTSLGVLIIIYFFYYENGSNNIFILNSTHILLLCSSLGFLIYNFPPAKIFMGDVGSAFLGLMIGFLSIFSLCHSLELFLSYIVLLSLFIIDATYTLFIRVITGHKPYEAHRSHCYQILSRRLGSHKKVVFIYGLINALWLFPISFMISAKSFNIYLLTIISFLPTLLLMHFSSAGKNNN